MSAICPDLTNTGHRPEQACVDLGFELKARQSTARMAGL
jgi:hypothetical protein